MFRELFESKPKPFYLYRPRPNSKKWTAKTKRGEGEGEYLYVEMDEKDFAIKYTYEGRNYDLLHVYELNGFVGIDWDSQWDWSMVSATAAVKIQKMIEYLKGI